MKKKNKNTREADPVLERMNQELQRQGKKQAELNSYLNLPRGTYSGWKLGRTRSFYEHIVAIATFLDVDVLWLLTGSSTVEDKRIVRNPEEAELLELYHRLDGERCPPAVHL